MRCIVTERIPMLSCIVNGQPVSELSVQDRGLAYGQGLFETLTLKEGNPQDWKLHMQRLELGANRLGIPFDNNLLDALSDDLVKLLAAEALPERTVLKIILTRGAGGRGYAVTEPLAPNRILQLNPFPAWPADPQQNGIRVILCETRLGLNPQLAGIKHLNRLEQVLARSEWQQSDIAEGLVCDMEGYLVEGTMSNLFWLRNGELFTPDLTYCGIDGIIRQRLIERVRELKIKVSVGRYQPADLLDADEVFMTNSVIGLWPVTECVSAGLQQRWQIGTLSRQLSRWLAEQQ